MVHTSLEDGGYVLIGEVEELSGLGGVVGNSESVGVEAITGLSGGVPSAVEFTDGFGGEAMSGAGMSSMVSLEAPGCKWST